MNADQVASIVRLVMGVIGTTLINTGIVSAHDWETLTTVMVTIVGALLIAAPVIWSMIRHSKKGQVAAVAALPETHVTPAGDIVIKDTSLRAAAREAATPVTAGNIP